MIDLTEGLKNVALACRRKAQQADAQAAQDPRAAARAALWRDAAQAADQGLMPLITGASSAGLTLPPAFDEVQRAAVAAGATQFLSTAGRGIA